MSDRVPPESREGMLKITEIFHSLQGESLQAGLPTVFVRLTGCPLRCRYCDTAYAFSGGAWWTLDAVLDEVARYGARHVTVTGGEPLAQPGPAATQRGQRVICPSAARAEAGASGR